MATTPASDGGKLNDAERFDLALSQIAGKRLTYAGPLAKREKLRPTNPWREKRGRHKKYLLTHLITKVTETCKP